MKKIVYFIHINKNKIVIIDGLGKYQLNNLSWEKCNSVIYPYFCSKNSVKKKRKVKYFIGYKYMINNFTKNKRKIKKNIKNILFTSGGSDLNNSSYKFIRLFSKLKLSGLNLYMIQGIFTKKNILIKLKNLLF